MVKHDDEYYFAYGPEPLGSWLKRLFSPRKRVAKPHKSGNMDKKRKPEEHDDEYYSAETQI